MALGDPYANVAELELRLGRTDDGRFAGALDTASRHVERFTARQFNDAATVSARHYRPTDGIVDTDDFHTTAGLIVETDETDDGVYETPWDPTDFELEPLDGVVDGQNGWPFWVVRAVAQKRFPCRRRATVRITAQWGWAAVPAGIREATLAAADGIVTKEATSGVRAEAVDGYSVTYALLEQYGAFRTAEPYRRRRGFA